MKIFLAESWHDDSGFRTPRRALRASATTRSPLEMEKHPKGAVQLTLSAPIFDSDSSKKKKRKKPNIGMAKKKNRDMGVPCEGQGTTHDLAPLHSFIRDL